MTILVTGAAGFIGFHVCNALLARGSRDHGFAPSTTIAEGLPRFVAWYRAHYGV